MQIVVYITGNKERYLGGASLTLFIEDAQERQAFLFPLAKEIGADVIQMKNGDHLLLKR